MSDGRTVLGREALVLLEHDAMCPGQKVLRKLVEGGEQRLVTVRIMGRGGEVNCQLQPYNLITDAAAPTLVGIVCRLLTDEMKSSIVSLPVTS